MKLLHQPLPSPSNSWFVAYANVGGTPLDGSALTWTTTASSSGDIVVDTDPTLIKVVTPGVYDLWLDGIFQTKTAAVKGSV